MKIIRKTSLEKFLAIIFLAAILLAGVFLLDFFESEHQAQAGYPWNQPLQVVNGNCTVYLGTYLFNTAVKSGTQSLFLTDNDEGAILEGPSGWLNHGSGDPLIHGAQEITIKARNAQLDAWGNWSCPPECVSGYWGTCYDAWSSPYPCYTCTGYYNGEISVTLWASGTRNSPDEANLAPPGANGFPYGANIGVTTGSVNSANPTQPILNWTFSGSAQERWHVQVDNNNDFSSPEWNSGDQPGANISVQTGVLPANQTFYWRVASCGDTKNKVVAGPQPWTTSGDQMCAWTAWANGGSFTTAPASCSLPWGGTLASGSSVTAYQASSVPCGSSCASQTRTCTDGTLSGSYTSQTCSVATCPSSCSLPWGGSLASGSSVTAYQASSVPCGSSCVSQTRTCTDGTLDGSYTNSACSVAACTLGVSLSVAPASGSRPLTSILTATVSGTAVGTINYTFYCDRNDAGINITLPADGKYDGQAATSKSHNCTYSTVGTFYPKIIVERGSATPATDKKTVTVTNQAPTATNLSVSSILESNYCTIPAHSFSWLYTDPDGDAESQFQLQVDNNSDFTSPEVNRTINSTIPSGNSNSQAVIVATSVMADKLVYNTLYYWQVKVWDNGGLSSVDWVSGSNFRTANHSYPNADFFNWLPANPSAGEQVTFNAPSQPSGVNANFSWIFAGGNPGSANGSPATTTFNSSGTHNVTLTVDDNDHPYSCFFNQPISVRFALPNWKEIAP